MNVITIVCILAIILGVTADVDGWEATVGKVVNMFGI